MSVWRKRLGKAALFTAAALGGFEWYRRQPKSRARNVTTKKSGKALLGGDFALQDMEGRTVTLADFRGQYLVMYFGFTHCPDICPVELGKLSAALDIIDRTDVGRDVTITPLFVSVDPKRDTPARLRQYAAESPAHSRTVFLRGTDEQLADMASKYRVYYSAPPEDTDDYQVDHSIYFYLLNRTGEFVDAFGVHIDPEDIAKDLLSGLKEDQENLAIAKK